MKNGYSQFINYAKGMYVQDVDIIDDLKQLVCDRSMLYPENVTVNDIISVLLGCVSEYMVNSRDFTQFMDKISPHNYFMFTDQAHYIYQDHPNYDFHNAVIQTCLSKLRNLKIYDKSPVGDSIPLIDFDEPNDDILPLNTSHPYVIKLLMENEND